MIPSAAKYWLLLMALFALMYGSFVGLRRELDADKDAETVIAQHYEQVNKNVDLSGFDLIDQQGKTFDAGSVRGKVWVASFFFTNCPAVCWKLNQRLADLQQETPDSPVRYVSFTCDPDNDTPEALARYAKRFEADPARWSFLTGDLKQLSKIALDRFQVSLGKEVHSDRVFVIDKAGRIVGNARVMEPEGMAQLKKLIAKAQRS